MTINLWAIGASRFTQRLSYIYRMPRHERLPRLLRKIANHYLDGRKAGVLHIGAHEAAEARFYRDKSVIWVEANPELMPGLERNIAPFPNQRAYCALLGDAERDIAFHIASNCGASSSVFAFGPYSSGAQSLWPDDDLRMQKSIRLSMQMLDHFIACHAIDVRRYDHWVLDVQGAELLVLKGAINSLTLCKVISTEISTVEVYKDGALYPEIRKFLAGFGFTPLVEPHSLSMQHGDITFVHISLKQSLYFRFLLFLLALA
jgi:FkbM family methyltransferase